MNLKKRFYEISKFLKKHQYLHELEIMERFPYPLKSPYQEWANELIKLNDHDLIELENFSKFKKFENKDLNEFILQSLELSQIPQINLKESKIPKELNRKLTPKKKHEIQTIKSYVESKNDISTLIDVGSGAGHLSSAILSENNLQSFCIDMNEEFQKQGIKKLKYWYPKVLDQIYFIPSELNMGETFPFKFNPNKTMMLGLHSCGALSSFLVKSFHETNCKELLNFGCCYHKLKDEYNISELAKKHGITFTNHALTMAAKCFAIIDQNDLLKRNRVKRFRYALHFFAISILNKSFGTLGNAKSKDYQGLFSDYAHQYYSDAQGVSKESLDSFYNSELTQKNIQMALCAGVIRSKLGRLIELYICLDRAIFLEEKGCKVEVAEIFDRKFGPRNIGLIASNN